VTPNSNVNGDNNGTNGDDSGDEGDNNGDNNNSDDDSDEDVATVTRSGREVRTPSRYRDEEVGAGTVNLLAPEQNYYSILAEATKLEYAEGEIGCVGAGIGGGFENTQELHVLKYNEAMNGKDHKEWQEAVDKEHQRMLDHKVWEAVPKDEVPKDAKVIGSTWAMKKKANGTYRARINGLGYEQVEGVHYDKTSVAAPVTNEVTIRITLVLMIMAGWVGEILDVKGALLHGR